MNIGIDFDNTIAWYETLFRAVAVNEEIINGNWKGSGKTELRNYLRDQPNGEKTWMRLQGLVYGKHMHGAEMMPGVANFLMSCNMRKHKIYIVSHKTEYGHFDPEKISLRFKALEWMETKHFFDPEYFGMIKENVFFADTREEKVKKIEQLKCDWFIDDLPEVFEENNFPSNTGKILFESNKHESRQDLIILESWRKISEKILGKITNTDVIGWSKRLIAESNFYIEKIPGRGNSSIYKAITSDRKIYALKYYPDRLSDRRERLNTEFQSLQMLHENNINNVPKSIEKSESLNLGLYEWIDGVNINEPSINDLGQVIDFVENLYSLSQIIDKNNIGLASEACLSVNELINQIEKRLLKLKQVSDDFLELSKFLDATFEPLWRKVRDETFSFWSIESLHNSLPKEKQILSPSDFGFHNIIKLSNGTLSFIDFDYFGWDDPVKLTADFILHPAMNLSLELKEKWNEVMLKLFSKDQQYEMRLNAAMPLYAMRWSMIVLNEYLPIFAEHRKEAQGVENYNLEKSQNIQLDKAKYYCEIAQKTALQSKYIKRQFSNA